MMDSFASWLEQNGLTVALTTSAGDTLYVNREKRFAVLSKFGEYGGQSFNFDDVLEFKTYDDEILVAEWMRMSSWRVAPKGTRFSTNEVYMKIRLNNYQEMKMQIFHATNGNIPRESYEHANLMNYAWQVSQYFLGLITG